MTEEIIGFLGQVWPWFPEVHGRAAGNGLRWGECSTPFVHREDGRIVSHVGVLELPLVVAGRPIRAAGVHAVATHPDHRGRGHMRRLMEAALAFIDARYETAILTAGEAEIYQRFGFEVVPEHRFTGPRPPGVAPAESARTLALDDPADLERLRRLLRDRSPVSRVLGVTREFPVFLFDTALRPLHYAASLDAVLFYHVADRTLHLYDVVAERIPALREITACIAEAFDRVEVQFSPDLLAADLEADPWLFDGDEVLMARGFFLPAHTRACMPRSARC